MVVGLVLGVWMAVVVAGWIIRFLSGAVRKNGVPEVGFQFSD
jgi:hypothetical protein